MNATSLAGWDWQIRFYYNGSVAPPKRPGGLAIETVHKGEASRDLELSVGRARSDIGRIVVVPLSARARALSDGWTEDTGGAR